MAKYDPRARKQEQEQKAKERGKRLGPGKYLVGCAATNPGTSSQKRTPYVQGRLVALEDFTRGRSAADSERGSDTLHKVWQTEKAAGMIADIAIAVGSLDPFDWESDEEVAGLMTAKPFIVTVQPQRDNPKYTEVRWIEAWDGRMPDGSEPSEQTRAEWREMISAAAERHDAYLERQEGGFRGSSGGGSSLDDGWKAPSSTGGASYDDDEIPF